MKQQVPSTFEFDSIVTIINIDNRLSVPSDSFQFHFCRLVSCFVVASIAAENPLPEKESKDDLKKPVETLNCRRISHLNTVAEGSK